MIGGSSIVLGAGGITASTPSGRNGVPSLGLPIALSAPQTWSVAGSGGEGWLQLTGHVTGAPADTLGMSLSSGGTIYLTGNDVEVGPVKITGASTANSGNQASANGTAEVGTTSANAELNGTDGQAISLTDAQLQTSAAVASVGAMTSTGGLIVVGTGNSGYPGPVGTLHINGGLTMDSGSALEFSIDNPGTTAGQDYTNVTATGPVNLGGATGDLDIGETGQGGCPSLHPGDIDTLISTTGTLSGTFAGIPDGKLVALYGTCQGSQPQYVQVHYTAHTVTATILGNSLPVNTSPPTISGSTVQGQTLIASPGAWTNGPTSYSYQWFDCDPQLSCVSNGVTSTNYTLSASDVGDTLMVQVTASNANGTSASYAQSARTAVVTASSGTPPSATASPTISGTLVAGHVLTEAHGKWTGRPTRYSYTWKDCNSAVTQCSTIAGASAQTYTLKASDAGHRILVLETAFNASGPSTPASSAPTATVKKAAAALKAAAA